MSWFRLNALAVGSLSTTILLGVITFYMLSLRHKGPDAWFLAGYIGSLFILLLSYTLRYALFTAAALATGQIANLIVFGVASLIQFAYWFGGNSFPKESRIVLTVSLLLCVAAWGSLFNPGRFLPVYDFGAEYFTYDFDPRISVLALIEYLWAFVVFARKVAATDERGSAVTSVRRLLRPAGRVACSHRNFALLTFATIPIALQYVLLHTGVLSRSTYTFIFNTGSLVICLLIFFVYTSSSPRPVSFIAKLVGIPLAVVMVAFGVASNALMPVVERTVMRRYAAEAELARIVIETRSYRRLPADVRYVLATSSGGGGSVRFLMPADAATASSILTEVAEGRLPFNNPLSSSPLFHYLDLRDRESFFFTYPVLFGGVRYWVGFSYQSYRDAVHQFALKLVWAVLLSFVVISIGFPLIFRSSLVAPLQDLAGAVDRVSSGNFRQAVHVTAEDEIGVLARGYNQMIDSLRTMEGNFRALAENAYDAILIVGSSGEILYANGRAGQLAGCPLQELRGSSIGRFIPGSSEADLLKALTERIGRIRPSASYETEALRADGSRVPVEIAAAVTMWQDEPAEVIVVHDISERKQAEQLTREHERDLMRTDKLASLGALVAGVAHEINNPNHAVAMNTQFLRMGVPGLFSLVERCGMPDGSLRIAGQSYERFRESCAAALGDIQQSTERVEHIVDELKRFVRGKPPALETVDLNRVVRNVVDLARGMIDRATHRFAVELSAEPLFTKADFVSLEQVLLNLVENACQALPDQNRSIRVRTRRDETAGLVVVSVTDEGRGIPPEDLPRLTDPLFSTRADAGGTGLGLSVTSRIVGEHGGSLRFESVEGAGTTVTVELPTSSPAEDRTV